MTNSAPIPNLRSFWVLLVAGLALRCVALTEPLVDAHLLRQCQTAAVTESLESQPGFPMAAQIPWLGNLEGRFLLELPLYNYGVLGLNKILKNLDMSGKLVSVLLWGGSFFLLQAIWQRMLRPGEVFWANLTFIVAPLGVFYGQAFMPEMLVQVLAFGFIVAVLRYAEKPDIRHWVVCAITGLAALLVKFPETIHLYLLLGFVVWQLHGWKGALLPRYLVAGAVTVAALKMWSGYVDAINNRWLPEWSSQATLVGFIGPLASRFTLKPWLMIAGYLGAFVAPGPVMPAALGGLWVFLQKPRGGLLGIWLISVVLFYLVWFGNAGSAQSYYNLPALPVVAALFGVGMDAMISRKSFAHWRNATAVALTISLIICIAPVLRYLFTQDRTLLGAAAWLRTNTPPGTVAIFRPNHRWDMVRYPYNPVLAYYAERPTFVLTDFTPEPQRQAAIERARYAVVTMPPPAATGLAASLQRLRGSGPPVLASLDWLTKAGFSKLDEGEGFTIYVRR